MIEIRTKYEDLIKLSSMKKRFADAAIPVPAIFTIFHEARGRTWTRSVRMCTKYRSAKHTRHLHGIVTEWIFFYVLLNAQAKGSLF